MPRKCPEGMTRWQWLVQRFWEGVNVREPDECWEWEKACVTDGYGTVAYDKATPMATHRIAWMLKNGPIPKGLQIMHLCDNPPCCNPMHLKLGTVTENMIDRNQKMRGNVKLNEDQVRAIRADPRKHWMIAREYKISGSLVCMIKKRKRWAYVE